MASWIEVKVRTVSAAAEAVSYCLQQIGCAGVVLESPSGSGDGDAAVTTSAEVPAVAPAASDTVAPTVGSVAPAGGDPWHVPAVVIGYVPVADDHAGVPPEQDPRIAKLTEHMARIPSWGLADDVPSVAVATVRDENWADAWKKYYHPIPAGKKLVVHPTWEEPADEFAGRIRIRLDPGMAFGTGAHPSTILCLEALERLVKPGARLLDVGTGSGILSIAAAMLGAGAVVACDHDSVAAAAARDNVRVNAVSDRVRIIHAPVDAVDGTYDCIVANLVADLVIDMAEWIPDHLAAGGTFLGCGIVERRQADVAAALARVGLTVVRIDRLGEWRAVEATVDA